MTISVGRVGMVPISSIIVASDRAREDMGDLLSMENNMKEIGLITPLAVKDNNQFKEERRAFENQLLDSV